MRHAVPVLMALTLLTAAAAPAQVVSDNPLKEVEHPYEYDNAEAEFRCTWPGGCAKLRRRSNPVPADADPFTFVRVHHVSCDRHGNEGEGCAVAAIFNEHDADGNIAGPAQVVARLQEQVEQFRIRVTEQKPLEMELGDGRKIEGLELKGVDHTGLGQAWIRGWLNHGDIYIQTAWNQAGGLWEDPEMIEFFDSFRPGLE